MSNQEETIAVLNRICEKLGDIHGILSEHMEYTRYKRPSAEEIRRREQALDDWIRRNQCENWVDVYHQSDEYRAVTAEFPKRQE